MFSLQRCLFGMKYIITLNFFIVILSITIVTSAVYADSFKNCFNYETNNAQSNIAAIKSSVTKQVFGNSTEYHLFDKICNITDSNKKIKRNDIILIDVRPKSQYQQFRINNSINLKLSLVKSKKYWQNKLVVLINNGTATRNLIEECGRLRKNGFKQVFVYKAGIRAWVKNKSQIIGTYTSKDLSGVLAQELFNERDEYHWQLIDATDADNKQKLNILKKYFPNISKYSKNNKLKVNFSQFNKHKDIRYLFIDNTGDKINLFDRLTFNNLYYLRGGVNSFAKYINLQYKMTNKKEFTLQKPQSCK